MLISDFLAAALYAIPMWVYVLLLLPLPVCRYLSGEAAQN